MLLEFYAYSDSWTLEFYVFCERQTLEFYVKDSLRVFNLISKHLDGVMVFSRFE